MKDIDTEVYKHYISNITPLYDTVKIQEGIICKNVSYKIIDNNKKIFKNVILHSDELDIDSPSDLNKILGRMLHTYAYDKCKYKINEEINNDLVNRYIGGEH